MPLVLLGVLAMFTLPHQFHVGVVECRDERHVRTARWMFPLYLVLIALPVLPLARAGDALLASRGVPSDLYVLALPLSQGHEGLALFAFLGGLSAATGMVIVSTHDPEPDDRQSLARTGPAARVVDAWQRWRPARHGAAAAPRRHRRDHAAGVDVRPPDLRQRGARRRRRGVVLRAGNAGAGAGVRGVAPADATARGVGRDHRCVRGLGLVPAVAADGDRAGVVPAWIDEGPFGAQWLAPDALFGLTGWSRLGRAVGASLFAGTVTTALLAVWRKAPSRREQRGLDAATLRNAGNRFLSHERVTELLADAPATGPVLPAVEATLERELAAVLGSASARVLLDAAREGESGRDLDTVAAIVDEASQDLRFNQRLLEAALQNMSQGISVVDAQLRLVAWNRRYAELFGFPETLLQVGMPISDLAEWSLRRMSYKGPIEDALARRLAFMRAGTAHLSERVFPDGSIVEIRGNPMPGGGFVATFTDVTAFRRAESDLIQVNETLEQRVVERTTLLEHAKHEAEHANDAKSRFLAAIGHDLLQPLHAAHLFTDALAQQLSGPRGSATQNVRGAAFRRADPRRPGFDHRPADRAARHVAAGSGRTGAGIPRLPAGGRARPAGIGVPRARG